MKKFNRSRRELSTRWEILASPSRKSAFVYAYVLVGSMGLDGPRGNTVQFNVRLKTLSSETGGYLLAVLLDRLSISCCWLIAAASLQQIAYARADQLIVVASPAENSKDKYAARRHRRFPDAVVELAHVFSPAVPREMPFRLN